MTIDATGAPAIARPSRHARATRAARYAGFAAAWVLFITVARLIVPQSSQAAGEDLARLDPPADFPSGMPLDRVGAPAVRAAAAGGYGAAEEPGGRGGLGALSVGSLVGREYIVRVLATPDGPRYTVCSADGSVLRENLDARTLAESFPALDPATKRAEPTQLMQADPDR